jgi:predicted molibdopterin-dependent oxidoreductase YjgC
MEKCIRCRRCIRACDEIQAVNAITMMNRGFRAKVATAFDTRLQDSNCIFCGQCISVCPTGALTEKESHGQGRDWQTTKVTTTCPYCGVGCNFDLNVRDGKVVKVTSTWNSPANKGVLCVKGRFGWQFLHHPDRLTKPLMKASLWKELKGTEGTPSPYKDFVETDWETALDTVADRLSAIKSASGSDALAILPSAPTKKITCCKNWRARR